jgi:transcriptional regulator with XRE-family HTH domain
MCSVPIHDVWSDPRRVEMTDVAEPRDPGAPDDRRTEPERPRLGAAIREARLKAGISQRELARRLSLSSGMISQIETEQTQPSVTTLLAISRALDVSLDGLFRLDAEAPAVRHEPVPVAGRSVAPSGSLPRLADMILREDNRSVIRMAAGVQWHLLTPDQRHPVLFMMVTYPAGAETAVGGEYVRHPDSEYFLLLEGELEVSIEFETDTVRAGDSMWFDSTRPHRFVNLTDRAARGVWFLLSKE